LLITKKHVYQIFCKIDIFNNDHYYYEVRNDEKNHKKSKYSFIRWILFLWPIILIMGSWVQWASDTYVTYSYIPYNIIKH
jgi:hypothetical protein